MGIAGGCRRWGVVLRTLVVSLAAFAVAFTSPSRAASVPVLQPSSEWRLNFADDSCRLARLFGTGDDRVMLSLERYEPGDGFYLVVAGKPLRMLDRKDHVSLQFGPVFAPSESYFRLGSLGELNPAVIVTRGYLNNTEARDGEASGASSQIGSGPDGQRTSASEEAAVNWLEVRPPRSDKSIRLLTGSLGKPLAAMRDCTQELMTHWGIDVEAHKNLTRRAQPIGSPGSWMSSDDFPRSALIAGDRGLVFFRLDVDAKGLVTGCHIQHSAGREEFETAVCRAITKHGAFSPALDAAGKPIATYWLNSVLFDYPSAGSAPPTGSHVRKN